MSQQLRDEPTKLSKQYQNNNDNNRNRTTTTKWCIMGIQESPTHGARTYPDHFPHFCENLLPCWSWWLRQYENERNSEEPNIVVDYNGNDDLHCGLILLDDWDIEYANKPLWVKQLVTQVMKCDVKRMSSSSSSTTRTNKHFDRLMPLGPDIPHQHAILPIWKASRLGTHHYLQYPNDAQILRSRMGITNDFVKQKRYEILKMSSTKMEVSSIKEERDEVIKKDDDNRLIIRPKPTSASTTSSTRIVLLNNNTVITNNNAATTTSGSNRTESNAYDSKNTLHFGIIHRTGSTRIITNIDEMIDTFIQGFQSIINNSNISNNSNLNLVIDVMRIQSSSPSSNNNDDNSVLQEQAEWFALQDVILMAHGAGVTNVIFARTDTILMQFYPYGFYYPMYEPLIEQVGCIPLFWYPGYLDYGTRQSNKQKQKLSSEEPMMFSNYKQKIQGNRSNITLTNIPKMIFKPIIETLYSIDKLSSLEYKTIMTTFTSMTDSVKSSKNNDEYYKISW